MIGKPTPLANGNFEIYYQVVIENNRAVDLVDVSVVDDLATQFVPGALKNVSGLTLATPPANANSSIALNLSGWDGTDATDLIDQSAETNRLAAGDSFEIGFKVEVDTSFVASVLQNTTSANGTAVDSNGEPLIDVTGRQIVAADASDSRNALSDADSDPTSLLIPRIELVKTRSDAVSSGDNWEVKFTLAWENTGTVALDKVEIFDDLAATFGGQFAGVTLDSVTAGAGNKGSAPIANTQFASNTSASLVNSTGPLEIGDSFEVVFTVTIDPNAVGTAASGLDSQATAYALAVDGNGDPVILPNGAPAFTHRVSNNGVDPAGETGKDNLNGTITNYPADRVFAAVAVERSAAGTPIPLPNGNFEVIYQLITANTGTVDLAELTLIEDLAGQIGSGIVSAGKVTLASPPRDTRSSVTLDSSWSPNGWAGLVNPTPTATLAVGDSFTVQFAVEIDSKAVGFPGKLENKVVSGADAVDLDSAHNVESDDVRPFAADLTDAGSERSDSNIESSSLRPTAQDEQEPAVDPAPLYLADLTITKSIVGQPVVTDRGNFVVSYQLAVQNTGTVNLAHLSLVEDLLTQFGSSFVKAGNLTITSAPRDPDSSVSGNSAGWNGKTSIELLDSSAANVLVAGDSFTIQFEVEINPSKVKSPPENQVAGNAKGGKGLSAADLIDGFIDAPGPIYSGTPNGPNSQPASTEFGPSIPRGRPVIEGSIFAGV